MQGFSEKDLTEIPRIEMMARWTPFACALFGAIALLVQSPWIMGGLAILTSIGALTKRSGYDLIYNSLLRPIFHTEPVPKQGCQRRLGCGIGAVMYAFSAIGLITGSAAMAVIPALTMIILGGFAAATQICFASMIYVGVMNLKATFATNKQ